MPEGSSLTVACAVEIDPWILSHGSGLESHGGKSDPPGAPFRFAFFSTRWSHLESLSHGSSRRQALGSSAPEILLSVVETLNKDTEM